LHAAKHPERIARVQVPNPARFARFPRKKGGKAETGEDKGGTFQAVRKKAEPDASPGLLGRFNGNAPGDEPEKLSPTFAEKQTGKPANGTEKPSGTAPFTFPCRWSPSPTACPAEDGKPSLSLSP